MTATSAKINPADHLPDHVSPAQIKGLLGNVDIWRDAWGIPHVKGASYRDAFAGLGFAQAQDRLWQMEALLRRGTGRYAEWLGARAVAGDVIARQMNGAAASRRDFALLSDEGKAMLEAYARGVNAFIALGRWPVEYKILGCEPAAFEPWHSIAIMRQIGFLMGSVWWKLWRAAALPIVGPDNVAKLRFDDGGSDLLCVPPGVEGKRLAAALADLKPGISALLATAQDQLGAELDGGSNNWAVAGRPHLDWASDRRRRSAPRAGNAEHVRAGPSRLRRVRRHRPHRARRSRFPTFRAHRRCRLVRDACVCRYPRSLCRAVRRRRAPLSL